MLDIPPIGYISLVLALGITAQWIAWRFKLPSILLLLAFGFALGHFTGVKIDRFLAEDPALNPLLSVVGILVAIILFEGGLTLKFSELKTSGAPVLRLCTIGVVISFALTTAAGIYLLGYDIRVAGIIGAILTVTGPTVIAPLLRTVNPSKKISSIVKWEGIVVDPIGAIIAVLVFQAALTSSFADAGWAIAKSLTVTLVVGLGLALTLAKGIEIAIKKHLIPDYLQPVFLLSVVAVAFWVSNLFEKEAGLLTVTVLGIALANQKSVSVKHILEFKENLRVLIISSLFIILSGRIESKDLMEILPKGLLFLAALIIVIRPASVLLSNIGSKAFTMNERTFVSMLAPRGIVAAAVASIFALELEEAAHEGLVAASVANQAEELVALIFLVIVGTVAFYGLLARPLAKKLGLAATSSNGVLFAGASRWVILIGEAIKESGHPVTVIDTNYNNVSNARMAGLSAHRANILSDFVEEELEFSGIGTLVAATANDEVNSLAVEQFLHHFGRANLWQITPVDSDRHHMNAVSHHMRGRYCFAGKPRFDDLEEMASSGAVVKKVLITDVFTYDDFMKEYDGDAFVVFLEDEDGTLKPAPADLEDVGAETTIFALVPAPEEETPRKKTSAVAIPLGL